MVSQGLMVREYYSVSKSNLSWPNSAALDLIVTGNLGVHTWEVALQDFLDAQIVSSAPLQHPAF